MQWLLPGVVGLWLAGVLAFSIRLLGGWRFTNRLRSTSHPAPGDWQEVLQRIRERAGVSEPVHLLVSALVTVPTVIGWLRPAILVPVEFLTGVRPEYITALLAHEMAHIRRNDYLASMLQSITEAVLFYHPAVWWISEQIRAERELCCDDLAVAAGGDVLLYARALAELESQQSPQRRPVLAANGGSLLNRIRRLMDPTHALANNFPGPGVAWAITVLWLAGVGVATVHAARTAVQASPETRLQPTLASAASPSDPASLPLAIRARDTLMYDPFVPAQVAVSQGRAGARGAESGPVPVVVSKVRRSSFPLYLNGLGNVTPYNSVIVRARVDGQIMSVNFQEGDLVKEGQVLFSIDPRPYQMVLAQAEKQYAGDQARLDAAQVDLGRYRTLAARNAIQQGQVDEEVALVAQLDGTVKADAVALESAKLQISYATVTAPIAGRIGLRRIDSGNIVRAADGTALAMIAQIQPIAVIFDLAEDNLQSVLTKLRSGVRLPTELFNRDHSKKLATGYLLTVDNQIDATTGTAKLKAIFSNTEEELFPNQFVNVRLLLDTLHDQIVIPTAAVQRSSEGAYVYVVDDNSTVHVRQITLGASADSDSQILKGLEEGQRVVVAGIDRLENNVQVRVRE